MRFATLEETNHRFFGFLLYHKDFFFSKKRLSQDHLQGVSDLGIGVQIPSTRWTRKISDLLSTAQSLFL